MNQSINTFIFEKTQIKNCFQKIENKINQQIKNGTNNNLNQVKQL